MRTFFLLFFYVVLILLLIPLLLFCYVLKSARPIIFMGKWAMSVSQRILGIRVEVTGAEKIAKEKPYVFMSNHLSFIDGPLLFLVIPQPIRVILKKEVFRIPFVGLGMKLVGFIPVDRKSIRGGKQSMDRAAHLIKEKGFSFLIFPEGTRSLDGRLQPFKRGGFFIAIDSQVPIVPITIKGTYELMPKASFFAKKGTVKVVFHPPVPVQGFDRGSLPGFLDRVRSLIQSGLISKE